MCASDKKKRQEESERNGDDENWMKENSNAAESVEQAASIERQPNPWETASWASLLCFWWPTALLKLGMTRPLKPSDLPEAPKVDQSETNRLYFDNLWQNELKRNPAKPSLHTAILSDFFRSTWIAQPMIAAATIAKVVQSVALGLLIESFGSDDTNGYTWAAVLSVCGVVVLFEHHQVFLITWHKGMQLRTASVAAIYAKSLRLSSTNQEISASSGKILNLASNDVERYLTASLFINFMFWAPVQSFGILGVGIWILGPAFAAGYALLLTVYVPLQYYLSRQFGHYRSRIAAITDRRVTLVSQAVFGARVMKMSGWEHQFLERIAHERQLEIQQIRKANTLKAWNDAFFFSSNVVISISIFLVHVAILGETLTPRTVFTVMSLVNVVQLEMTKHVSLAVMGTSECRVSVTRIQKFLEYPEIEDSTGRNAPEIQEDRPAVTLENVTCYWNQVKAIRTLRSEKQKQEEETAASAPQLLTALQNASLEFEMGTLTCIIGSVGSGKSALLQAIVGELSVASGTLTRNYTSLSYAAQDAWIMDGTVRENILMGMEWYPDRYDEIVRATGLTVDFGQFRSGDQTIVGDRGVQCSGGQRARMGLARALYRDADVLVCDDPLSAVDAKVGRLIFHEAILKLAVKRGKCVVLATHQHQYINDARCVFMVGGRIECVGSYDECVEASGGNIAAHVQDSSVDNTTDTAGSKTDDEGKHGEPSSTTQSAAKEEKDVAGENDGKEMNVTGLVRMETFKNYAKAMGGVWVAIVLLLIFSITQASVLVTIAFLGRWAERSAEDQDSWDILRLVIGLGSSVVVLALFRAVLCFWLTVVASQRLHDKMTEAVLRAKIEFFDTNPLGRILNRFSADVGSNDDMLPHTLFDFFVIAFMAFGAIATAVSVLPFILIALPPFLWYFMRVRTIFVTTTRELKRLEGLARSPIFAMLSESLSGISTIRSNDALAYFQKRFTEVHDAHSRAFFCFIASSRWVGFRMDSLMFLFICLASFMSVLFHRRGWFQVDPAILGLALSMLLQLAGVFQWCIRQSAEVINQMVSVERVLGFGNLPSEAELELETDKELENWPSDGTIEVNDLSARYRETLPLSLKNVSFSVPKGSRVGVVGRTGSGKSTLMQCVFRLLEAETGSIKVDGVDVAEVGLHTLRTRISVIPQVPVLFSGCTVRENLDPFSSYSDDNLRDALRDVHMLEAVNDLPKGLESMVSEGGSNFSVGQRQLLCLARAILKRNRILILDEPTANVDRRTDQLLQEALHKSFKDATILSVAHRLDTIIDHDFILVLGHGEVLEYGSPVDLLQREGSHFASMVHDTGPAMSQELRRRATMAAKEA